MKVKIGKDANDNSTLHIECPLTENKASRSGNSTVIATTRGQQFIGNLRGKPTYLQLNVLQMEETAGGGMEIEGADEQPTSIGRGRRAA